MSKTSTNGNICSIDLGMPTVGRAVTDTLYVSPNGNDTNGSSWANAYTTIQGALAAASTDADECTAILVSPHATYYDINTTGDPTYTGNYHITGTHRIWAVVKNTHASADSVLKFTGKVSVDNLAIFTDSTNNAGGLIFTNSGWRVRKCGFNSSGTDGANTSLYIDGSGALTRGGIMEDVQFVGHQTHTKAIHINKSTVNEFHHVNIHETLTGIHIEDADSDKNYFCDLDIGVTTLGIDIDAGNGQHFDHVNFHDVTTRVDDEVGDHVWTDIHGQFPIAIEPDNTDGVSVDCAVGADTWGTDTEIRAAATSTKPFRIVATHCEPNANRIYQVRFSSDSGSTFYDQLQMSDSRRESVAAPSGTEYIFNAGTRISASVRDENGGGDVNIWIEVQEI